MDRVDTEALLDSEYFLDLQSFAPPAEWERLWAAAPNAYRVNGASLDCCTLLLRQELRFHKQLTPDLAFRFRFEQDEDKEKRELHHWLELERRVWSGLHASIVGEPTFNKEDADIGFGLAWRARAWSASARRLFVDWNFNERNSTTQRYARMPITDQASVSAGPFAAAVEWDHPLRRRVPDLNRQFFYRRTKAAASWSGPLRVEYGYEYRSQGDDLQVSRLEAHRAAVSREMRLGSADVLELGAAALARASRATGVSYRRWELQPYARWRRQLRPWLTSELASFSSGGEDRRLQYAGGGPDRLANLFESKLGAGLDFTFGPSGRIGLYASFDLDEAGSHLWDGGNARAMFFF